MNFFTDPFWFKNPESLGPKQENAFKGPALQAGPARLWDPRRRPWACRITNSRSSRRLTSIESVMTQRPVQPHSRFLQCMKVKSEREAVQSCPTLSDPMDCSPPGSSTHGIFQARVLEWGAIAFSNTKLAMCIYTHFVILHLIEFFFLGFSVYTVISSATICFPLFQYSCILFLSPIYFIS